MANSHLRGVAVLVTAALVPAGLLAACSSGRGDASTNRSSTTTTASVTTTTDPRQAAAVESYRAFWSDYIAAGDPVDPNSPRLRDHATGDELQHVVSAFLSYKAAGEVLRGTIDLAPVVVKVDAGAVTIRDCYANHILRYDAATGQPKGTGRPDRTLVTVTLAEDGGVFKVSNLTHESDGCLTAS